MEQCALLAGLSSDLCNAIGPNSFKSIATTEFDVDEMHTWQIPEAAGLTLDEHATGLNMMCHLGVRT